MQNDPLAHALSTIQNSEKAGKKECLVHPSSKVIQAVLSIMNKEGYVGTAEKLTDARGGVLKINLLGNINKCGVVKPRFAVKLDQYEKFEKRYLPAKGVGILVVSTPNGIMTHEEAKNKQLGGRLLAYCY